MTDQVEKEKAYNQSPHGSGATVEHKVELWASLKENSANRSFL
jgi:hypothetical protein